MDQIKRSIYVFLLKSSILVQNLSSQNCNSTADKKTGARTLYPITLFIGGLPSWYSEKMDSVVLPTTLLEPRFRGSIRNLKYRDTRSDEERLQEMMAYKVSKSSVVRKPKDKEGIVNAFQYLVEEV